MGLTDNLLNEVSHQANPLSLFRTTYLHRHFIMGALKVNFKMALRKGIMYSFKRTQNIPMFLYHLTEHVTGLGCHLFETSLQNLTTCFICVF